MERVKTVIVEDNPLNHQRLRHLIDEYCPQLEVLAVSETVELAICVIRDHNPSLIFLDVELPDGTGFEILEYFKPVQFKVIFFTGHLKYAYKAIKFNAIDFLLKPVRISDLVDAVNKAIATHPDEEYSRRLDAARLQFTDTSKVILHEASGFTIIDASEIIKLEANANYTNLYLTGQRMLSYCKILKDFEEILQPHPNFMRVHRSHLINIDHVVTFSKQGVIKLTEGITAALGDSYREKFLEYFG
ncbi:MAG: LytTR family DNA-binding domain-containing protein [Bacteroidota bacterium]